MTRERKPGGVQLSGKWLKIFACACMLCLTLAASILRASPLGADLSGEAELSAQVAANPGLTVQVGWMSVLQLFGGLSIPVFAFLLVEGFTHTSNLRRYLLTVPAFAVVSEVPYDLAMYGRPWSLEGQNALFTCAICLLMLYGLREFAGKRGAPALMMRLIVLLAALLWTGLLRCAFGPVTVLLVAIYYLLRERKLAAILLGCTVSAVYITSPLSGLALWFYGGARGGIKYKYLYYAYYPLLLLCSAATAALL